MRNVLLFFLVAASLLAIVAFTQLPRQQTDQPSTSEILRKQARWKAFLAFYDQHVMQHLLSLARLRFKPQTWQTFRMQVVEGKSPENV